jgi:hypothetical protein
MSKLLIRQGGRLRDLPFHAPLSSPAQAGDPVSQRRQCFTEKPRRTGFPAFAGNDGR